MWLQMIIGRKLIDQIEIYYEGMVTCAEREEYQQRVAQELNQKHLDKVKFSNEKPVFLVIGQQSKLNYMIDISYGRGLSDEQFVRECKKEMAFQVIN